MRLVLIGKWAHGKGNIRHVRYWSKAIASILSWLFTSILPKFAKDKCSHCAMALDYCFRCLSAAPSNRIIALWVHPLRSCEYSCFDNGNIVFFRPISQHSCTRKYNPWLELYPDFVVLTTLKSIFLLSTL